MSSQEAIATGRNSLIDRYGALFYTVGGRAVQIAVGIGTLKVQTAYLSKEQMGEYGLFLNLATLLIFLTIRPLLQYFSRRLHDWFSSGMLYPAFKRIVAIEFALGLASVPIIALLATLYTFETKTPLLVWAAIAGAWFFFYSLFNTIVPALNLLGFKRQWVIANSVGIISGLLLAWLTAAFYPTAPYWTLALTIGFALGVIVGGTALLRLMPKIAQSDISTEVAPFSFLIPATIAVGGIWLQFQAFRLVSVDFMSLGEYGLFTAGYGLAAGIMAAFEGLAAQYLQPFFYSNLSSTSDKQMQSQYWSSFAGTMTALTAGTCLISAIFGPLLCRILLSATFKGAWPYFLIGMLIESARVISGSISLGTHVTMKVQHSLRSYIVGLVALAVGILAGKIFHNFTAFTLVLIAGSSIHLAIITWDVSRHLKVGITTPGWRHIAGLLLVTIVHFVFQYLNLGLIAEIATMAAATVIYLLLILKLNAAFSPPHNQDAPNA